MHKVLFSKFSKERKEEYQILTQILEDTEDQLPVRKVLKKAVNPAGEEHISKLEHSYRELMDAYSLNQDVEICPCQVTAPGTVEFLYIKGESLEERFERHIRTGEWEILLREVKKLHSVITEIRGKKKFQMTDAFVSIFGDVTLPEGLEAGDVSNVDLIPTNLLFNGDKVYVIDYEWVFPFPIPFSFTVFRALFHSVEISKLPGDMITKVYETAGISQEERTLYLEMEMMLQSYITGENTVLSHLYQRMDRQCYLLRELDTEGLFTRVSLTAHKKEGQTCEELYNYRTKEREISVDIKVPDPGTELFKFYPEEKSCVIILHEVTGMQKGNRVEIPVERHTASLVLERNYYFLDAPELHIKNEGYDSLSFKYRVLCKNHLEARQMAELVLNILHLRQKIQQMEDTKVWKAYSKYKEFGKEK